MAASKRQLPAALAKRAEAATTAKATRLVAQASADIALIARRRSQMSEAFYDIGEALVRLKRREVVVALGCKSFAELCEARVGLSSSQADRLVDVVTTMTRTEALSVGATKAASIVALMRATPECDSASDLLRRGARVGGKVFDVKAASSMAIARVTAEVRRGRTPAGRVVTKQEREACALLHKALVAAGSSDAKVTVKAGRTARAARALIDLPVADLARLAKALRATRHT